MHVPVCQFSGKTNSFDFFRPNLPKSGPRVGNSENCCWNKNQHRWYTTCANFQLKWTTLNFLAQICWKMDLGLEIQKTNVRIRISIVKIPSVPIFRKNGQLWLFWPKLTQKWILGLEYQKSKSGFGTFTSKIPHVPIFN